MEYEFVSAHYQFDGAIVATTSDGQVMTIPIDEGNRHYILIMEWVSQGNEITPYVAPPAPPKTIIADTFWNSFTSEDDEQLDAFDSAMRSTSNPLRLRRLYAGYSGSVSMTEGDDLWNLIRQNLVTAFGEERTIEIMGENNE
jgi:hypothetical protein